MASPAPTPISPSPSHSHLALALVLHSIRLAAPTHPDLHSKRASARRIHAYHLIILRPPQRLVRDSKGSSRSQLSSSPPLSSPLHLRLGASGYWTILRTRASRLPFLASLSRCLGRSACVPRLCSRSGRIYRLATRDAAVSVGGVTPYPHHCDLFAGVRPRTFSSLRVYLCASTWYVAALASARGCVCACRGCCRRYTGRERARARFKACPCAEVLRRRSSLHEVARRRPTSVYDCVRPCADSGAAEALGGAEEEGAGVDGVGGDTVQYSTALVLVRAAGVCDIREQRRLEGRRRSSAHFGGRWMCVISASRGAWRGEKELGAFRRTVEGAPRASGSLSGSQRRGRAELTIAAHFPQRRFECDVFRGCTSNRLVGNHARRCGREA
ncbi:hypothetical protein B0H16DRAFT_223975 [Mycena metata]|uniref:Uncharacterized protein n=1 Tax=Mycena metata TaxID=1033252 RepID=A0AAD7HYK5_9AGAR|nr:hypothetical protein B0H16DRAFT_223975 [Mycena metata]